MTDPVPPRPTRALAVAAGILAVEGLVIAGFGVLELAHIVPSRLLLGGGVGIVMLCYAALLFAVARGVVRGRRWSRAPGIATQLLQLPLAWSFRGAQTGLIGAALAAGAITVLVCLLLPSSTVIFVPEEERRPNRPKA